MRRHLLVLVAILPLVLLTGCSAAGSISMDPVSNADLAEHASRSVDPGDTDPDAESRAIRGAIENGSATIEARRPPVETGLPFAHEGAYYDLSWSITDRRHATGVDVAIDYNASDIPSNRIAYGDLPAPDRRALDALLPPHDGRRTDGYDFGTGATYTDAEAERSVLVPTQRYDAVVYDGEAYPIRVEDTHDVTLDTYRYTATLVANDTESYAREVKAEHLFTLTGLDGAERDVVSEATNGSYYAEDTDDDAYRGVLDHFRAHDAVERDGTHGSWVVRYDGAVYWADLHYDGFADGP